MYSIQLENGEFTVIECSEELERGEEISGSLDSLGYTKLRNNSSNSSFSAIVQNIHCNERVAKERCFLR